MARQPSMKTQPPAPPPPIVERGNGKAPQLQQLADVACCATCPVWLEGQESQQGSGQRVKHRRIAGGGECHKGAPHPVAVPGYGLEPWPSTHATEVCGDHPVVAARLAAARKAVQS